MCTYVHISGYVCLYVCIIKKLWVVNPDEGEFTQLRLPSEGCVGEVGFTYAALTG